MCKVASTTSIACMGSGPYTGKEDIEQGVDWVHGEVRHQSP